MKKFLSILASILFCTVFFVPTEDAPLSVYFAWAIWCFVVLYIVGVIFKVCDEWSKED